jgi:hypothetical protein
VQIRRTRLDGEGGRKWFARHAFNYTRHSFYGSARSFPINEHVHARALEEQLPTQHVHQPQDQWHKLYHISVTVVNGEQGKGIHQSRILGTSTFSR